MRITYNKKVRYLKINIWGKGDTPLKYLTTIRLKNKEK